MYMPFRACPWAAGGALPLDFSGQERSRSATYPRPEGSLQGGRHTTRLRAITPVHLARKEPAAIPMSIQLQPQAEDLSPSLVAENSLGGRPQATPEHLARRNPTDRRDISTIVPRSSAAEVAEALSTAEELGASSSQIPLGSQLRWLLELALLLEQHAEELADFGAREIGQSRLDLVAEIIGAAQSCRWLHGAGTCGTQLPFEAQAGHRRYGELVPVPVVVVNPASALDPATSLLTRVTGALARGGAVVLRPPPECAGMTRLFIDLLKQTRAPVERLVVVNGDLETEEILVRRCLDGGLRILGRSVAPASGFLPLRPSPAVVLADANVSLAVPAIAEACLRGAGQTEDACHHAIVDGRVAAVVREELARRFVSQEMGDPRAPATTLGPLLSEPVLHAWNELRAVGLNDGAELIVDGPRLGVALADSEARRNLPLHARPRLFANVTPHMALVRAVGRGPTLLLLEADGLADAQRITRSLGPLNHLYLFSRSAQVLADFGASSRASAVLLNPVPNRVAAACRRAQLTTLEAWSQSAEWRVVDSNPGGHASIDTEEVPEVPCTEPEGAGRTLRWPSLQRRE